MISLKKWISVVSMCFLLVGSAYAITDPAIKNPGLDLYLEADGLVWTTPQWFWPQDQFSAPEDINFWLDVLPFADDRNEDVYLVIPGLGLITPVVPIPEGTADYNNMLQGREIPINNYLREGIIEYVNSVSPGHRGKRIDFGHSNYFASDSGKYKTIFANLMRVDVGDQVRYYVKQSDGSYQLFKYQVTSSYPTNPSNVSALQWDGNGADALIFGCYHGLDGRWMLEATYLGDPIGQHVQQEYVAENTYPAIPSSLVARIERAVGVMRHQGLQKRKYEIIVLFKGLQKAREMLRASDPDYALKSQVLDLIEEKLAEIYPS